MAITSTCLLSCKEEQCNGEMNVRGDQFLSEEISGMITSQDYEEVIRFTDEAGEVFEFTQFAERKFFERDLFGNLIECDDGSLFSPYVNREVFELGYSSVNQDTIMIRIISHANYVVSSTADLMPDDNTQLGTDRLFIYLSFQGCLVDNSFRNMVDPWGESQVRESSFTITKFGQQYHDVYGIQSSWSNGVILSYSRGIAGFNFCGKDYAQIVD